MSKLLRIGKFINLLTSVNAQLGGNLGYQIMSTPVKTKIKKKHLKFLNPAKTGAVHVNNKKVQTYHWQNKGQNILFLHGWSSHSYRWKSFIEIALSQGYSCLALDAPGHGLSQGRICNIPLYGKAITEFIRSAPKIDYVVAHSMGSISALFAYYINHNLPMPQKIILLASPGEATDFVDYIQSYLNLSPKAIKQIHKTFIRKFTYPIDFYSAPSFVKALRCEGLLIHDKSDKDTSYKYSIKMHENWPSSELWLTEGKDHQLKDLDVVERVFRYLAA